MSGSVKAANQMPPCDVAGVYREQRKVARHAKPMYNRATKSITKVHIVILLLRVFNRTNQVASDAVVICC